LPYGSLARMPALRCNARQGLVIAFTLRLVLTFVLSSEICIFK